MFYGFLFYFKEGVGGGLSRRGGDALSRSGVGLSGMGWGVLSGRGGAGGVSRGFQTVDEATRVADGGGGIGHGVVVEASLRQTDSGHGAGGRESGQAGQAVPHVVQDPGVA